MVLDLRKEPILGAGFRENFDDYVVRAKPGLFGLKSNGLNATLRQAWNASSDEEVKQKAGLHFSFEELAATASAEGIRNFRAQVPAPLLSVRTRLIKSLTSSMLTNMEGPPGDSVGPAQCPGQGPGKPSWGDENLANQLLDLPPRFADFMLEDFVANTRRECTFDLLKRPGPRVQVDGIVRRQPSS